MLSQKQWIITIGIGALAFFAYELNSDKSDNDSVHTSTVDKSPTLNKSIWKLYKPQNERFEVLLPGIPQHVSETHPNSKNATKDAPKDVIKYDVYLSQDVDGNIFMISLTQYPPSYEMGGIDEVLEAVKNGAVGSNSKNELKDIERSTFMNLPSLDFSIANSDSNIRSKVILDNKTLFVLTVMDKDSSRLESDFNTFVGSFAIKHPSEPKATDVK